MSTFLSRLTLVSGFPPLLAAFTILRCTYTFAYRSQETDPVVVVKTPQGCTVVSHHGFTHFLSSYHELPQDKLLLYFCCWDLAGHLQTPERYF